MTIVRLYINNVGMVGHEYIANKLWRLNIAQASSVTIVPYIAQKSVRQFAIIDIRQWCDTEVAYNFIQKLCVPEGEAMLVHNDDDAWPVCSITVQNDYLDDASYTTFFPSTYFDEDTSEEDNATTQMFEEAFANKWTTAEWTTNVFQVACAV